MTAHPAVAPTSARTTAVQHLWHPFADMSAVPGREIVLARGEGAWVFDEEGRRYLDASGGLWYCNVGHGRAELAEAAAAQMRELESYQLFDVFATRPALELADRVCALTGLGEHSAAFFTNGGSDGIDTAAKIARRFWVVAGEPKRKLIVAREGAYHGMNAYGTSLAGIPANAEGWGGPLIDEVVHIPRHDSAALEQLMAQRGDEIAAFIAEPVQAAGGIYPPADGYWDEIQRICRKNGALLIDDEVVTGFGRLGRWFGRERYGITPDMVVGAKGLSSGYLPIGVVVAGERVLEALWSPEAGAFRHGYTYSGHAAACAVALANLDIIEREDLVARVATLEPVLAGALGQLEAHPLVGEVRTVGLLCGVELDAAARTATPDLVERVMRATRERGVLVRALVGQTLQISPPFVISPEQINELAAALAGALDAVADEAG